LRERANTQAVIFGCGSASLTKKEQCFFKKIKPAGFILFGRNCNSPNQVKALVKELRNCVGNKNAPILIDQEGGRVQRLGPPHWPKYPAAKELVEKAERYGLKSTLKAVEFNARLIANDLNSIGISVNCSPVIDVPQPSADPIIGDRAFSCEAYKVGIYAKAACLGYLKGGIIPVIKHIPGHGRAYVDSHKSLPIVNASQKELESTDLQPFIDLKDMPWAMTAHIIYSVFDINQPATTSKVIISDLIRAKVKFEGVLISDDLSMEALSGDLRWRSANAIEAGCDLVLHCNGNLDEMELVAEGVSDLSENSIARLKKGEVLRRKSEIKLNTIELSELRDKVEKILGH